MHIWCHIKKINTFPIVSLNMDSIYDIILDLLLDYVFIFIFILYISHLNIYHIHFFLFILLYDYFEFGNYLYLTFFAYLFSDFFDIYLIHD